MGRKTVTSITRTFHTARLLTSRAVSLLLVLFILYGTTVEAAHRHGRVLHRTTEASSAVVDPGLANNLTNTQIGCNDCLICQLHHGFSTTLISVQSDVNPSSQRCEQGGSTPDPIQSATTTSQPGRAPPQIN
jgi:hypothetical protein